MEDVARFIVHLQTIWLPGDLWSDDEVSLFRKPEIQDYVFYWDWHVIFRGRNRQPFFSIGTIHIHYYITLHYITLHYIILHYITYIILHYITYIILHYITLNYTIGIIHINYPLHGYYLAMVSYHIFSRVCAVYLFHFFQYSVNPTQRAMSEAMGFALMNIANYAVTLQVQESSLGYLIPNFFCNASMQTNESKEFENVVRSS